jgi:hypothetical protein
MPVLKREDVIAEVQRALVEPLYRGTPDHERLADMARVFGIQVKVRKTIVSWTARNEVSTQVIETFYPEKDNVGSAGGSLVQE